MDNPIIEFRYRPCAGECGGCSEVKLPAYKVGQRFVWDGKGTAAYRTYTILSVHTVMLREGQESFAYFTKVEGEHYVSYSVHSERFISQSLVLSN